MKIFGRSSTNHPTALSIARNLAFRKGSEGRPGEWADLFAALSAMRAHSPHVLGSLRALPELGDQLLLTELHHDQLRIYSGLEFIIFDASRYLYYRMPGARPNGEGFVPQGEYRVRLHGIARPDEVFLTVVKAYETSLTLVDHGLAPTTRAGEYARLEAGELDYSWIAPELEGLVVRWLQFHGAAIDGQLSQPTAEEASALLRLAGSARSSNPRVRTEVARLESSLRREIQPLEPASPPRTHEETS